MQRVILISGFGGSGKSTCAEALWNHWDNAALVPADHLFHIRPFDISTQKGRDQIGRIKLRNSLALIQTFLDEGYEYILVDGLVWSQNELDAVEKEFAHKAELHLFFLHVSKDVRFQRAIARGDPGDDHEYLEKVEETIPYPWPLTMKTGKPFKIDADTLRSEAVLKEILRIMDTNS